jgi:hypothetical protein
MSEELQRLINQKLEAKVVSDIELHDRARSSKQSWGDLRGEWENLKWHIQQIVASSMGVLQSRINPKTGDLQVTNTVNKVVLSLESSVTGANLYAAYEQHGFGGMRSFLWMSLLSWHLRDGVLLLGPGEEPSADDLRPAQAAEMLMGRLLSPTITIVTKVTDESV